MENNQKNIYLESTQWILQNIALTEIYSSV